MGWLIELLTGAAADAAAQRLPAWGCFLILGEIAVQVLLAGRLF